MSERGYVRIDRGVWKHFAGAAFGEREAWLWMISSAAWKPISVRRAGQTLPLERGQLAFSQRFLAKRWGWSRAAVRRFLAKLEKQAMIGMAHQAAHLAAHITICNYDRYQVDPPTKRPTKRPKEEYIKELNTIVSSETDSGKMDAKAWFASLPRPSAARLGAYEIFKAAPARALDIDIQIGKFVQFNGQKRLSADQWSGHWSRWCEQAVSYARKMG